MSLHSALQNLNPRGLAIIAFALVMFAANSVLCRMALGTGKIDAASYSSIRLASGALVLWLIGLGRTGAREIGGDLGSALLLFLYAVPFSFAYLGLATGTGALILFGCVQATMLLSGWSKGERFRPLQWLGLALALTGLVYLVLPGVEAPRPIPAVLMGIAGVAWGFYSLRGRGTGDPFLRTKGNFIRAAPMALLASALVPAWRSIEWEGALLAAGSGAIASALGYVAWYAALKTLTASKAAVLQLLVPVLATLAGVLLLQEPFSLRSGVAGLLVVGGIALTIARVRRRTAPPAGGSGSIEDSDHPGQA